MENAIINYIEYLKSMHSLQITLHGSGIQPYLHYFAKYNSHECAYCMFVKTNADSWNRCMKSQQKALEKLNKSNEYFGSCYAGVGEFVFPIRAFEETVGMISVGRYLGMAEKRIAFAQKYGFSEKMLNSLANSELSDEMPDINFIKTL